MRACGFELGQEPYTAAALSAGLDCTLNRPPKQPARLRAVVTRRWIELVQRRSGFPPRQLPHAPPAQSMAATGSGRRWSPSAGGFPRTGGVAARGRRRPLRPLAFAAPPGRLAASACAGVAASSPRFVPIPGRPRSPPVSGVRAAPSASILPLALRLGRTRGRFSGGVVHVPPAAGGKQ